MAILHVIEHKLWSWDDKLLLPGVAGCLPDSEDIKGLPALASEISASNIGGIYCSDCEDSLAIANAMAQMLGRDVKIVKKTELREVNFGLWQGLTVGDLRQRYAKAYRQWLQDPVMTSPPTGETFDIAAERILGALNTAVRKNRGADLLMVLSPLSAALLHCRLYGKPLTKAVENLASQREIRTYDLDRISLVEESQ